MRIQIVMNRSGDTRYMIDPADAVAMVAARGRFEELAAGLYGQWGFQKLNDQGKALKEFDPTVERTVFIPQLKGG